MWSVRRLLIISSIILIASIFGAYRAFSLPNEIEERTTLLDYEQEGKFDYLVYLKPSYLFGPEPQEPPPPPEPPPLPPPSKPKYPIEMIDRFDMTFTYSFVPDKPVMKISEEVEVKATVRRPDVEQEEITLLPRTTKTGNFTVNFTLDMSDNISVSDITIHAYVYPTVETDTGPIFEAFTQRLAMRSDGRLLEVDADLSHSEVGYIGGLSYEQQGEFYYEVRLKRDSPFGAITLTAPPAPPPPQPPPPPPPVPAKTVGPGEVVFSKLVDKMDMTFSYRFKASRPVNQLSEEVEITAVLENPEVWSKSFVLVPRTKKSGDFTINFPLDLGQFAELFATFQEETGAPASPPTLAIKADVHTIAQTDFGPINEVFSQTLSTTLEGGILEWNEELVKSKPNSIERTRMIPNPKRYLELSVSGVRILSAIVAGIIFLLCGYVVWLNLKFKPAEVSMIERIEKEVSLTKKKYGTRLAEATNQTPIEGEKIIALGSIEDLIKVADELGKPIIHQAPGTPEEAHAYYVFDGLTRYEYLLTER